MAKSPKLILGIIVIYQFSAYVRSNTDDGALNPSDQAEPTDYNVALGKQASQSTSYSGNPANLAIDDSTETCSRTFEEKGATWTVDLGETHIISRIEVVTGLNTHFGPNFELYIGDGTNGPGTFCGIGPTSDFKPVYVIQCFSGVTRGRTVTIKNQYGGGIKLCDVRIYECADGYFGSKCDKQCRCENDESCAKDTGSCSPGLCAAGYNGTDCQTECTPGRYGASCQRFCHCASNEPCDVVDGDCGDSGCANKWVGPSCQTEMPLLVEGPTLQSPRTTASEMTIMWTSWSRHVDPSLSLRYQVEYKLNTLVDSSGIVSNESNAWQLGPVVNDTNELTQSATVVGLRSRSFYEFRVIPILHVNGNDIVGSPSENSGIFRTKCLVPEKPNITNVYSLLDTDSFDYPVPVIYVEWTKLTKSQSNCDNIKQYEIEYQKQGGRPQRALAPQDSSSKNITAGVEFDSQYWIVVIAHNNEPLDSSSSSVRIVTVSYPNDAVPLGVQSPSSDNGKDLGLIIGVVVGAAVIIVILLIIIVYRRNLKYNRVPAKEQETKWFLSNVQSAHHRDTPDNTGLLTPVHTDLNIAIVKPLENGHAGSKQPSRDALAPPTVHLPIRIENLDEYVTSRRVNDCEELRKEYRELIDTNREAVSTFGEKSENRLKNRFVNILPYDHSRVILEKIEEDDDSDYINASYIDGYKRRKAYIAAQGCNKWTIQDMWRMVWQENSHRIVMVTNLVEKGKLKCEQYWPENEHEEKLYGDMGVTLISVERTVDFVVRSFELRKSGEVRLVKQFHYTTWPDHGVPVRTSPIVAFRHRVRAHDESYPGLIVVHCSAGVGRTGAFIALDFLLEQAEIEGTIDVFGLTSRMRKDRVNMIQTVEQYIFVYDALLEALKVGKTVISCPEFKQEFNRLCTVDSVKSKTPLEEQYELLQEMSPKSKPEDFTLGLQPENKEKNRYPDILPADRHRPYLMTRVQGTNDYINAVFLDGYRSGNAYIVTQMPLPHTVIDLWRMVFEHKCGTIVMLNQWDDSDETMGQYWPEENEECECGPFMIEAMSIDRQVPDITVRELKLTYQPQSPVLKNPKKDDVPLTVNHFQFHGWSRDKRQSSSRVNLMTLLDMIERSQFKTGNHAIVLHCMDGVTHSGLFASISCIWERLKDEHEVDIFQAVKQLRFYRPEIIKDFDQYKFCYEMVLSYLEEFATYANFK